jgi:hypothetical protein
VSPIGRLWVLLADYLDYPANQEDNRDNRPEHHATNCFYFMFRVNTTTAIFIHVCYFLSVSSRIISHTPTDLQSIADMLYYVKGK